MLLERIMFAGQGAVVTGAAAGIGAATARTLASLGATVIAVDRDAEGLASLLGELNAISAKGAESEGISHTTVTADLTSDSGLELITKAVATLTETGVALKTLINNVGANDKRALSDVTKPEWERSLSLNLTSNVLITQALASHLLACPTGGNIVNVSSAHGLVGMPRAASYATSKAGLLGLTRQLAAEYAADGLRVNAVCPGLTLTERIQGRPSLPDEQRARLLSGRFAEADEVADTIAFLSSDAASYLTGVVIPVDGGYSVR